MYKEYQPCALLSPYIDKYWEFKGNPEYGMRINILPDGCTDFIFTLGEATQAVNSSLTMKPYRAYFIGPMNSYSELVAYAETVHMLGVRFLPCGLSRFIRLPLHELTNLRISADEVTCFFDTSFAERLCEEDCLENRVKIIEELFIKSLYKHDLPIDPQIVFAIKQINRHQGTTSDNLLSTAIHAGYYDVPHLSREIKRLSGNTPYSFLSIPLTEEDVTLTYVEA